MSRYYEITAGPLSYSSLGGGGGPNPGALNVELDVELAPGDVVGHNIFRVWGIGLADISQARKLFDQPFSMRGGMSRGLPLANPAQAGPIASGKIWRAWGNWIGTEQTLDIVIIPSGGAAAATNPAPVLKPQNIILNWKKGADLGDALKQTLQQAFPDFQVDMQIGQYKAPSDQPGFHGNLEQLARYLRPYTRMLAGQRGGSGGQAPPGISMLFDNGKIRVFDGSMSQTGGRIDFVDLVGQPTWIDQNKISIKTVMRGDLKVGQDVTLPRTVVTSGANGYAPGGSPQTSLTFQGTFSITSLRHIGNFRQADAASWVTVIEANVKERGA